MSTTIDQKAYLQKYLGGPSKDKKKKKKKAVKGKGFKIIDDDIDLSKLRPLDGDDLDILDGGEDAPAIAGIIDERPEELKKLEQFKTSSKWKVINEDDGFNSKLQIQEIKKDLKEMEKENEIIFGKMYSDSEDEKEKNKSDSQPQKKTTKGRDDDSDFSPPRKRDISPKQKEHSPKRKDSSPKRKDNSPKRKDNSPKRKDNSPKRKDMKNDSDVSPPRKEVRKERSRKPSRWGDADDKVASPKRNSRPNRSSGSDLSPPRKKNYDSDMSPPRKRKMSPQNKNGKSKRGRSSSDMSPPRRDRNISYKRHSSPRRDRDRDASDRHRSMSERDRNTSERDRKENRNKADERNRKRHDSGSDLSPKRGNRKDKNDTQKYRDMSKDKRRRSPSPRNLKRKQNSDSDLSPARKGRDRNTSKDKKNRRTNPQSKRKHDSDSDLSPPRKRKDIPHKDKNMADKDRNRQRRSSDSPGPSNKMAKTLEGKKAGLQDARQLREENKEFQRQEEEVFKGLADEISGRNAQAVQRKVKRDTSEERQKQKDKAERQKELDAKYQMWSKGIKQLEAQEARAQDYLHEASKPLARHRDDRDLEHSLKQVERAGDPMLQYIRDKKRERGELPPEKPTYKGNFPPNRFNIRPGYRWDGVDRSNGYEKKFFEQQSKRKAQEEEAYKWSTEDL